MILFASSNDGKLAATDGGFHCWIETDEWIIDFAAPLLPLIAKQGGLSRCEPSMMQRKISSMKECVDDLVTKGDFLAAPDPDFTVATFKDFASKQWHDDLTQVCMQWYVRPPKQMQSPIHIGNEKGEVKPITLERFEIIGEW